MRKYENLSEQFSNGVQFEKNSLVIHIPHASTFIGDEYLQSIILNERELVEEIAWSTDLFCDELFDIGFGKMIVADFSRLVCDVERFMDDDIEPGAKTGNGFFYTNTQRGKYLRENNADLKKAASVLYEKHQAQLTEVVNEIICSGDLCLIIDGHSFCNDPVVGNELPDYCIGADSFHTPASLVESAKQFLESMGYTVAVNYPFSGSMVPLSHYRKDKRVSSLMLEVNKRLYLNNEMTSKSSEFTRVKACISQLLKSFIER